MINFINCSGNLDKVVGGLTDDFLHIVGSVMYEHTYEGAKRETNLSEFARIREIVKERTVKNRRNLERNLREEEVTFIGLHNKRNKDNYKIYRNKMSKHSNTVMAIVYSWGRAKGVSINRLFDRTYEKFNKSNKVEDILKQRIEEKYAKLCTQNN